MSFKSNIRHLLILFYLFIGRNSKYGGKGKTRVLVFHHLDKPARFEKIITSLKKNYNFIRSFYIKGPRELMHKWLGANPFARPTLSAGGAPRCSDVHGLLGLHRLEDAAPGVPGPCRALLPGAPLP